jgi:hypothetical protein
MTSELRIILSICGRSSRRTRPVSFLAGEAAERNNQGRSREVITKNKKYEIER